jgi:hypothetical protein
MRPIPLLLASILFLSVAAERVASAVVPADACALLSQSEAAAVLGVAVGAGKPLLGMLACRWSGVGKPGDDVALLNVALAQPDSFEIGKTPMRNWNKPSVAGVGNDVYTTDMGKVSFMVSPTLTVKKGRTVFIVFASVPKGSLEQSIGLEKTAALQVLKKL